VITTIFEDEVVEQPQAEGELPLFTKPALPEGYEPAYFTQGLISAWRLHPKKAPVASEFRMDQWYEGYDSYKNLLTMETDHPEGPRFESTLRELAGLTGLNTQEGEADENPLLEVA
jgi:hypothetical protein